MAEREPFRTKKEALLVGGIALTGAFLTQKARDRREYNQGYVDAILAYTDEIDESVKHPLAGKPIRLHEAHLRQQGLAIHAFGDSRQKVNINANKKGEKEVWVHEGGSPQQLGTIIQEAGLPVPSVHAHAKEGDSSHRTLAAIREQKDNMIHDPHGTQIVIISDTGNDARSQLTLKKIPVTLGVVYLPEYTFPELFLRSFKQSIAQLSTNILNMCEEMVDIDTQRKRMGREGLAGVKFELPPHFCNENSLALWSLDENGGQDHRIITVPSSKWTDRGGEVATGGNHSGIRQGIDQFLEKYPEYRDLFSLGTCHNITDPSHYDGSYHFSPSGQRMVAINIAGELTLVSQNGYEQTVAARHQQMTGAWRQEKELAAD